MKLFLVILGISISSAVGANPESYERWEKLVTPHKDECMKESNVDPSVANNFYKESSIPNDRNFQCYIKCISEKLNFMDASGKFNVDAMKAVADNETGEIAEVCSKSITKSDPCEIAFEFATCCMKKAAELHSEH